ncbi:NADH dehydrogenase [ubiquinone] 1 alpha subcomplex subunit mitochondrial [Brachionus plicatilis]|uniref:NADH dehydrogenase [ubiquinone] 1 alpha subcomplex subunit mitochondrial n=1 Tax=Brachionus plicatilis TaxID=10195 RepID=A0A3M7QKD6_BRAPC|nr:NADH dehydrogenase [ubiquinone] 1 alpha subcomplex subunit mitochondrial [Brachionus plicatilis]
MMLSKVFPGLAPLLPNSKCLARPSNLKSLIVLSQRDFSIDQIGKRYEKPFDYKKKQYGLWDQFVDSTMKKLGENTLLITVEGNFGSGKSSFAKKLAKEIDFVYAREPDLDAHLYQLPNGHNAREIINDYVGDNKRFYVDSLEEWHLEPSFKKAITLQHAFYNIRWMQTRTALLHLMSTGQGVVLERSAHSDSVIAQALYENNLLSDQAYRFYLRDLVPNTLSELWKPHVVIYLDRTPEECLQAIKNNGKAFEKESKVYTLDLLKSIEKNYKKIYLPEMRNHLHILNFKSNDIDTERIIEELELLDFNDQNKFNDWRVRKETAINTYRKILANYEMCLETLLAPNSFVEVPEYLWYGEELTKLQQKLAEDPRFDTGSRGFFAGLGQPIQNREWL